tara:strand:- start:1530 stop:1883 length:354 start_codon:yes stop_codon:yes gene_type:complete
MPIENLTPVTTENVHVLIPEYIKEKNIIIGGYEDMMDVILQMIRSRYFFTMDKDVLRGYIEDLTYMYCPGDDLNKDRILAMLEDDDSDEEEDMGVEDIEETPPDINKLISGLSDSDC